MGYNIKIFNRLYTYFYNKKRMRKSPNGWLVGDCPNCGRENKFGISIHKNRSNCFVCGYQDKPLYVLMKIEGISNYSEAIKYLGDFEGTEYDFDIVEQKPEIEVKKISLPDSYQNIMFGDSFYSKLARRYIRSRGFDVDELSMKGWGYCTKGDYAGYIIIPFYFNNQLIYFNARRFISSGPKFNNPNSDDFGIGKNQIIYNLDSLWMYNRITIVESVMNAETLGSKAIAIGGKVISQWQLSVVIKSPVKEVVIILDSDAKKEAVEQALKLVNHKKVKLIFMPEEKDVNDMGKIFTRKLIMKNPWLSFQDIIKIKHKFNEEPQYSY
jgi:DNA primase